MLEVGDMALTPGEGLQPSALEEAGIKHRRDRAKHQQTGQADAPKPPVQVRGQRRDAERQAQGQRQAHGHPAQGLQRAVRQAAGPHGEQAGRTGQARDGRQAPDRIPH